MTTKQARLGLVLCWLCVVTGSILYVMAILGGSWFFVLLAVFVVRCAVIDLVDKRWKALE